uniref:Phorbol-ester/DAG-type domain-containing protein n=1 Tax=Globodera pallida TaxID=36090 RepID=A0A183C9H4_GLOPA
MTSHLVRQEASLRSEFEHFINSQIAALIAEQRAKNVELTRENELQIAIDFCKNFLLDDNEKSIGDGDGGQRRGETPDWDGTGGGEHEKHRVEVLAKLVELRLELEQYKESELRDLFGHNLATRAALAKVQKTDYSLQFQLCPEKSLLYQNYQCAECCSPIGYDDDSEKFARVCDYTGLFYCRRCHWNDEMVVPARIVRNWDFEKRPVCRATKQLLTTVAKRPLINLEKENPTVFKFVQKLDKMQKMRTNIMLMKCYFVSCKVARKLRILQHLSRCQHFVENDAVYTIDDLLQLANGRLMVDIEAIVRIFNAHITEECEICRGNAFFCELCSDTERIYPFTENVAICKGCCAVYHRPCFDRASKRCSRCSRRKVRRKAVLEENCEEEKE